VGADWSGAVWPGVRRAAEAVLSAAGRTILNVPIGEFSASVHSRLKVPKVLELVFVVDRKSRPWLVDLSAQPSTEPVMAPSLAETGGDNPGSNPDGLPGPAYSGVLHRVIDEAWGVKAVAATEKVLDPLFTASV